MLVKIVIVLLLPAVLALSGPAAYQSMSLAMLTPAVMHELVAAQM
jgi:hypothetical protein